MKLSDEQQEWIRSVYKPRGRGERPGAGEWSQKQLAILFGVSIPTIRKVLKHQETPPDESDGVSLEGIRTNG